jgi:yecA family protein
MKSTLDKILKLSEAEWDWDPDNNIYADFTLNEQDQLIAIINDDHLKGKSKDEISELEENASIHAYRILASFLDPSHIPLFLECAFLPEFEDSDIFTEDLITILPRYQSDVIQPCIHELNDQKNSEIQRMVLCDVLHALASNEIQSQLITKTFCDYLSAKHFTRTLNAHIIAFLIEINQQKHIDIIRECYAEHLVDITFSGDLEEVEISLGIIDERSTPLIDLFEAEKKELHLAIKHALGPIPSESDPSGLFIYLLDLYERDQSLSDPSAIDGYLTATLLNPTPQKPSEFLPKIWDNEERYSPEWENSSQAIFFTNFILAVQNKIVKDLQLRALDPMLDFDSKDHSFPLYRPWISGFLLGFHAFNGPDTSDDEELPELEDSIISFLFQILSAEISAIETNSRPKSKLILTKLNTAIYSLFKQNKYKPTSNPLNPLLSTRSEPQISQPKISRNSPCPCGSGQKYKRCCMN